MRTVVQRAADKAKKQLVAKVSAKKAAVAAALRELDERRIEVADLTRKLQLAKIANSQELSLRLELKDKLAATEKDLIDSVERGIQLKAEIMELKTEREKLVLEAAELRASRPPAELRADEPRRAGPPVDATKRATGGKKRAKAQINDTPQARG